MPNYTKRYGLRQFSTGDYYESVVDRERFTILDNELAFLSDIIGNGKITGWSLSDVSSLSQNTIRVSSGIGLIDRYVIRTFDNIDVDVPATGIRYLYMQKQRGILGRFSTFSDAASVSYSDTTAPAVPTGLAVSTVTYNSIILTWNANVEIDFSEYELQKSTDGVSFSSLTSTSSVTYTDSGLTENTAYYYRIRAVDTSDNESAWSAIVVQATSLDTRKPFPPKYLMAVEQDSTIQLGWFNPDFGNIEYYVVAVVPVDSEYIVTGSTSTYNVDSSKNTFELNNLTNKQIYSITMYSVSVNGIASESIQINKSPNYNLGPVEVEQLSAVYAQSEHNTDFIKVTLNWSENFDVYKNPAVKYIITVIENGEIISDPITVYSDTETIIETFNYNSTCRHLKTRTNYIFKVQAEDELENINRGSIAILETGSAKVLAIPSSLKTELKDEGLLFSWINSVDEFNHNLIKIIETDLDTFAETTIVDETNYGKGTTYLLLSDDFSANTTYKLSLQAVDEFGNESATTTISYSFDDIDYINAPAVSFLTALHADKQVYISWTPLEDGNDKYTAYYKIWRTKWKQFNYPYVAADFSLIATLPVTQTDFIDYTVTNYQRYLYFITTVDIFGHESNNPIRDGDFGHPTAYAMPKPETTGFDSPVGLAVSVSGTDIDVSWTISYDEFDGYEIYRSVGNLYSWTKAGNVNKLDVTFTDEDVLAAGTATYYYMVRKYKNEGRVYVSSSAIAPVNSIVLGEITTAAGVVTGITDMSYNLGGLTDPINDIVDEKIAYHTHSLTTNVDRRIDLGQSITVTDWTQTDSRIYTTEKSLVGSSSTDLASYYIVKVDGIVTSIFYEVIPLEGKIVFAEAVTTTDLSVECVGISEVYNELPSNKIERVSATQFGSGRFNKDQIPEIDHDGRFNEKLVPLQLHLGTDDGYEFYIKQNKLSTVTENLDATITFYDIINPTGSVLIAGTSYGLMKSEDTGATWTKIVDTYGSIHKIYYCSHAVKYLALGNGEVYLSDDGLTWIRTYNLEATAIVRDALDDGTNIYVSTDLGVFYISIATLSSSISWIQSAVFSGNTSDTYGLWYSSTTSYVYVSTEIGLFASENHGINWSYVDDFDEQKPIWNFVERDGYVFALTNTDIWRKEITTDDFSKVASMNVVLSRNLEIFDDHFLVATDEGLKVSDSAYDIYTDIEIEFEPVPYVLNVSVRPTPISLIRQIDSALYIGSEQMLFRGYSLDSMTLRYEQTTGDVPTFFIDQEEQLIGFYYNTLDDTVYFDRNLLENEVSIANQYQRFKAQNNGWLDGYYDAVVTIYNSRSLLYTLSIKDDAIEALAAVTFDTFTENNSNLSTANKYQAEFEVTLAHLQDANVDPSLLASGESIQGLIAECVSLYDKTYAQYIGNVKYGSLITIGDYSYFVIDNYLVLSSIANDIYSEYTIIEDIESLIRDLSASWNIESNTFNGLFVFTAAYSKGDQFTTTILKSSVLNSGTNTHKEIEDTLDLYNSGLPTNLAEIQQSNILKTGLFFETIWEGQQGAFNNCDVATADPYQMVSIIPRDKTWYDNLNSTVDFTEEQDCGNLGFGISYVTSAVKISDSAVLVGGYGGLLSVDITTLDMTQILFNAGEETTVKDLKLIDGTIYLVTDHYVYTSTDTSTWSEYNISGLEGNFIEIIEHHNNFIMATSEGVYYINKFYDQWQLAYALTGIYAIDSDVGIFALSNNSLYSSSTGVSWNSKGSFGSSIIIYDMDFYRGLALMASSSGLRCDNGTFYSNDLTASLVNLKGNVTASEALVVSSIAVNSTGRQYIAGANDGTYFVVTGGNVSENTDSGLDAIHEILYIDENKYWLFGFDKLKSSDEDFPIKLSTGIPF